MPHAEVTEVVLEEVPDISYADIGGLKGQIEQIRDAVEMPFLHPVSTASTTSSREGRPALRPSRVPEER